MKSSEASLIGEEAVTHRLGSCLPLGLDAGYVARAAMSAHLAALTEAGLVVVPREPTEAMWQAWRSVNCKIGEDGMEEFTYFAGDYGNWLACHLRMMDAAPASAAPPAQNGDATPEQDDGA